MEPIQCFDKKCNLHNKTGLRKAFENLDDVVQEVAEN